MEKVTRRVIKRWSGMLDRLFSGHVYNEALINPIEYAHDHADLGAALNGFSLNETNALSGAIEKTGQAVDATYMSTTKLVRSLNIFIANQGLISFLAARSRAKLGGASARVLAVCHDNQEVACLSPSETCPI